MNGKMKKTTSKTTDLVWEFQYDLEHNSMKDLPGGIWMPVAFRWFGMQQLKSIEVSSEGRVLTSRGIKRLRSSKSYTSTT